MTAKNELDKILISPLINGFTLVYFENNYNLWFEDTIVKTIENIKKPTNRIVNKLNKTTFPKFKNNNGLGFSKDIIEIYEAIIENMSNGNDGFNILKNLFNSLVVDHEKTFENLDNATDKIKNTYVKNNIKEKSLELPNDAILKLLEDNYKNSIEKIRNGETKTIYIDCDILKKYKIEFNNNSNESLYTLLERKPLETIETFEEIVDILIDGNNVTNTNKEYYIKFDYNGKETKLNDLLSDKIGSLIKTTGVVKGLYKIKPVMNVGVFECRGCMRIYEEKQKTTGSMIEPSLCNECGGRSFRLIKDESSYYNSRKILLEEPIEDLGNKTNPRNILVVLTGDGDFINKVNVGDKVSITGILSNYQDDKTQEYNFYIEGNNMEKIGDVVITITDEDEKQIIELSKEENILDKLVNSSATTLMLPTELKQGMLCSIVGGGSVTSGRQDIHSLIITNPGNAKSDLFEWIYSIVEKCIMTSGASSSGVGLTGAIDKDAVTGQNILKAGALVLANNGICIGDEIDKLNKKAFGQLNNMIEKGFEDFNKGGINERLHSKATFIGGANPKYERFDNYKTLKEQIIFPPSFLSRMDLLFIFKDDLSEDMIDLILDRFTGIKREIKKNEIDVDLLKKYLYYAKHNFNPVLTMEAKKVARSYARDVKQFMESHDVRDIVEFTFSRFINSIARISGAIAKLHLRNNIIESDVEKAIKLKNYCFKLMGYDIENGTVDKDLVNGETSSSKMEQYQTIFNIIHEAKEEKEDDVYKVDYGVAKQFIKSRFVELTGLSERTCDNVLDELYDDNKLVKNPNGRYMYYDIKEVQQLQQH